VFAPRALSEVITARLYSATMPYDEKKLRLERLNVEAAYHAAYGFWSLKGVIAERWAHGPTFGAFNEGPNQVILTPALEEPDRNIAAVYGLRASGLNAEGRNWTAKAPDTATRWLGDVYEVLRPKMTVRVGVSLVALYPLKNPTAASQRLRKQFYRDERLEQLFPSSRYPDFHSAVDWLGLKPHTEDSYDQMSTVIGVIGPVHRGLFFAFEDRERDSSWWMGMKLDYLERRDEDGIQDVVGTAGRMIEQGMVDFGRIARSTLPTVVD
jgi:hypothetical protein